MAPASGISLHPGVAACLHEYAGAGGRGGDRARRGAFGLRHGEVLRRRIFGAAARGEAERGARRRQIGRASCRERGESAVGDAAVEEEEDEEEWSVRSAD